MKKLVWLSDISLEELEQELQRRKKTPIPAKVETPDFTNVVDLCQEYIDDIAIQGWADGDFKDHIFEAAMTAVFRSGVWDWIRSDRTDRDRQK